MELFDKEFVHFIWDDDLKNKKCLLADSIGNLVNLVNGSGVNGYCDEVKKSRNAGKPFEDRDEDCWRFAYYDPRYECKKAFNEGKPIQFQWIGKEHWTDVTEERQLTLENINLRIKPEEHEYRPFVDFSELMEIIGTKLFWVKTKDTFNEFLVTGNQNGAVYIVDRWYTMQGLFDDFTFPNGSPCGVKLEW